MAFGTDIGGIAVDRADRTGIRPHEVEFGMTPMQAIQSATLRAAELLGQEGELGVVAAGARADIIAVDGDPLADVGVLKNVRFVMKDGAVYQPVPGSAEAR